MRNAPPIIHIRTEGIRKTQRAASFIVRISLFTHLRGRVILRNPYAGSFINLFRGGTVAIVSPFEYLGRTLHLVAQHKYARERDSNQPLPLGPESRRACGTSRLAATPRAASKLPATRNCCRLTPTPTATWANVGEHRQRAAVGAHPILSRI